MKRKILNNKDYELVLKDKFGNNLGLFFTLKAGENELEIPFNNGYYQSKNNEQFFIYDGDGVLNFESECIKKYDFEELNLHFLDYFLGNGEHDKNADSVDIKLIDDFFELLNFNETQEKAKITPPRYDFLLGKVFKWG